MNEYDSDISEISRGTKSDFISQKFTEIKFLHASKQGAFCLYRANHFSKWVVLKALKEDYREDPFYESILKKEFQIGHSLRHPNIINTIDFVTLSEIGNAIVLEYIDGVTLRQYLADKSPISIDVAERQMCCICDATSYLHFSKIIHRDLKPENIMIERSTGLLKIIDLGCADASDYNIVKGPAGTRRYAAPEQLSTDGTIDIRTDIFAIGRILSDYINATTQKWNKAVIIARRCCYDNPAKRYPSAEDVKKALTNKRKPSILILTILLAIMTLGLIAFIFFRLKFETEPTERQDIEVITETKTEKTDKEESPDSSDYSETTIKSSHPEEKSTQSPPLAKTEKANTIDDDSYVIEDRFAVDLGLSVLWGTNNLYAVTFYENGKYYAWGEPLSKSDFSLATYEYFLDIDNDGKWSVSDKMKDEFIYDTATIHLGDDWSIPSEKHFNELINNCKWEWTISDGRTGYKITGPNGNNIFLPAAGFQSGMDTYYIGERGMYWSSTDGMTRTAICLEFTADKHYISFMDRHYGLSIRPIRHRKGSIN